MKSTDESSWLLEEANRGGRKQKSRSKNGRRTPKSKARPSRAKRKPSGVEQWLAVPNPRGARENGTKQKKRSDKDASRASLAARLREAEKMLAKRDRQISDLEKRLASAETSNGTARKGSKGSANTVKKAKKKPAASPRSRSKGGKLNINSATFEQFRDSGLSVTVSARLVAHRDSRGGFKAISDLDDLPGISTGTRQKVKEHFRVARAPRSK